jgi:uncharacterized protein
MVDSIKSGTSRFGQGLFALQPFATGEIIFKFSGRKLNFLETIKLGEEECYPVQIDHDRYIYPDPPYCYINHSCDPNCGINNDLELFAITDILKGEELFFDYSTTMLERHWQMNCFCNSSNCRKLIQDFDLLPDEICRKYLDIGIVLPFIQEFMEIESSTSDNLNRVAPEGWTSKVSNP